jgi:hypothetical protein
MLGKGDMKIQKYIWTVLGLSPLQFFYQFKYRCWGYRRVKSYKIFPLNCEKEISISELDEDEEYIKRFRADEIINNHLWLLNDMVRWNPGEWNYPEKTHLFNFNLQYFEYGVALAAIYKKTGDYRYYKKIEELYLDWHNTCFSSTGGDAWHPYTVSVRLRNLLIIYGLLGDKKEEWLDSIKNDLFEQYAFLQHNLELNLLGNHLFENLTTLYICSVFFADDENTKQFFEMLLGQIKSQILEDGMHFERSFMYHNLILEDILRVYKISDEKNRSKLKETVQLMANCIAGFEDEHRLPAFNDAGSNVAKRKSQLLKAVQGIAGIKPTITSALDYAGYYRFDSGKISIIADAGKYAPRNVSGHGHCDMLSFELYYDGKPILVNAGTYQYQSDLRHYFRSTIAHNTLQIKGIEQSEIWKEHRTGRCAKIESVEVTSNSLVAKIKDYKGNWLSRKIEVSDSIKVSDSATSGYVSYWHIHPSKVIKILSKSKIQVDLNDNKKIVIEALNSTFEDISNINNYSEEFGKCEELPSFASTASTVMISVV